MEQAADQTVVEVTAANRQVYYHGYAVRLPTTFGGREFDRTITDDEFLLSDITTGEVVVSFPLPMVALRVRGRHVASYAIRGVHVANPTAQWARKIAEHEAEFARRQEAVPEVFGDGR
ncbi:hypothetical protein A2U19_11380 [Dietzia maris]|nr:hypothetical protein A2U19_11380 [Dietzia maris]